MPGKIRRRLGHGRETPTDTEALELRPAGGEDAQALSEAADLADTLGDLIVHRLTSHQREVLVALAVDGVDPKDLAARLDSTPGAVYKTLHDARSKLKRELAGEQAERSSSIVPLQFACRPCAGSAPGEANPQLDRRIGRQCLGRCSRHANAGG